MATKTSTKAADLSAAAPAQKRAKASKPNSRKVSRHRASAPEEFKTSMLTVRIRDELKREASATLAEIGISLPEAVRVFLGRVVSERRFPFPLEVPNAETAEALRESGGSRRKRYTSVEEMFDALEKGGNR